MIRMTQKGREKKGKEEYVRKKGKDEGNKLKEKTKNGESGMRKREERK